MKRALAERAKQSLPNGVSSPEPMPSNSQSLSIKAETDDTLRLSSPPLKIARTDSTPGKDASGVPPSPRTPSSASRGSKRQRDSSKISLSAEDPDDTEFNAFYLRQQNRALGSELRMVKYQLDLIEKERDYRRSQCLKACQSLHSLQATWTQMEAALLTVPQNQVPPAANQNETNHHNGVHQDAPRSTGSGKSVELVGSLLESLAALGNLPTNGTSVHCHDSDMEETGEASLDVPVSSLEAQEKSQIDDLMRITDNISNRANYLRSWISGLVDTAAKANVLSHVAGTESAASKMEQEIAKFQARCSRQKAQIQELARSRDEWQQSDRRVRRGLYRLAANRMPLNEVLKHIEQTDEDKELAAKWMAEETIAASGSSALLAQPAAGDAASGADDVVDSALVEQLKKQLFDVQEIARAREINIQELVAQKESFQKRINELSIDSSKNENALESGEEDRIVLGSELYAKQSSTLSALQRENAELKAAVERIKARFSEALGNEAQIRKALEDLQDKNTERWTELTQIEDASGETNDTKMKMEDNGDGMEVEDHSVTMQSLLVKEQAKTIITLKHKLLQALENVRQAESTRQLLTEALSMNESLEAQLDELKEKYETTQQQLTEMETASATGSNDDAMTPKPKGGAGTASAEKMNPERLYKDYRKAREEAKVMRAKRDSARAKLEHSESERKSLMQSNAKLIKQAAEKDDMNAKSLSTILHLKQTSEQIRKEKESLEEQLKSANQLALAARLASNARERLSEEFDKSKEALEMEVKDWEAKFSKLAAEKDELEAKVAQHQSRTAGLHKEAESARDRCAELVAESTKLEEEKRAAIESLAVAKKEAAEAQKASADLSRSGEGGTSKSKFSVEQLETQVSHLKSRLCCAVCNVRDKKVILIRCRHMFCKECVEVNIKNRSRKCPACGLRFDTKDVGDVWF